MIKKSFLFILVSLFVSSLNAQMIPISTSDYGLKAYPISVRYQKYETDSTNKPKDQRSSFIDDYLMNFNENRLLVEKINYIGGKNDRYSKFTYNVNRTLDKEEFFEPTNKIISTTSYSYAYLGRPSEVVAVEYPASLGGANKMVSKQTYKWNEKGQLSEYSTFGDDATIQKTIKYFYGPQDSLIYTLSSFGYNRNIEKTVYNRDFNFFVKEMILYRNDSQVRRETYTLDDKNQIVNKKVYNGKDKLTLDYKYTYDEHGYMTSEIGVDPKGAWAIEYYYKYEKDQFFNWTKKTTFDGWQPKYVELRKFEYSNKQHFYDDLKDAATKKVVRERSE